MRIGEFPYTKSAWHWEGISTDNDPRNGKLRIRIDFEVSVGSIREFLRVLSENVQFSDGDFNLVWREIIPDACFSEDVMKEFYDQFHYTQRTGVVDGMVGRANVRTDSLTEDFLTIYAIFRETSITALFQSWEKFLEGLSKIPSEDSSYAWQEMQSECPFGYIVGSVEDHITTETEVEELKVELGESTSEEDSKNPNICSISISRHDSWTDWKSHELKFAFKAGRELVRKLASDIDFTERVEGSTRWDSKRVVETAIRMRYQCIPSARFSNKPSGITLLLDISPSCYDEAEVFAAIAAGAAGAAVHIFVGYNGSVYNYPFPVQRSLPSYEEGRRLFKSFVGDVPGQQIPFEMFVSQRRPSRLVIFGDHDGCHQYVESARRHGSRNWWWFANVTCSPEIPDGWTIRNYVSGMFKPTDLMHALKRVK